MQLQIVFSIPLEGWCILLVYFKIRVQIYRDANRDTAEYKQKHKEETYKYRKAHPDIIKKLNIKHSKTHYDKVKAITKIQSAIRNRNAKNEFDTRFNLKQEENKKTNAITKIQNAIRNRNAINEFASYFKICRKTRNE